VAGTHGLPSEAELARRSAVLHLPEWLAGGDPTAFGQQCRWRLEPTDRAAGEWRVRLDERVRRKPAHLIRANRLATAANAGAAGSYARLRRLAGAPGVGNSVPVERVQAELDRLARERPGDLTALMYSGSLATTTTPAEHLATIVQQVLLGGLLPLLPDSAAYVAEVDVALSFRYAATRVLLQVHDDPSLISQRSGQQRDELIFNSGRWLFSDTAVGLGAYLSPLFLSLSPWVWAISAPRAGGVVIYTLGRAVIGRRGEAAELLQLFLPPGRATAGPGPQICALDIDAALMWWITALDRMFTEITDPAQYQTAAGQYDERRNFEALLSVEQAFRNVQSLSAHDRDGHTRRVLLFDTLDTLSGIRAPDFDRMCELACARRALTEIEEALDPAAGRVLLPRASAAVLALEQFQHGFFLRSRLASGGLRVPDKRGNDNVMSLEKAAAAYLRILRNAGHAFGSRPGQQPRDEVLLMSHTGEIPVDLPDLAYLYLLRLLARPEDLRRRT
jgi:hypothetical protein